VKIPQKEKKSKHRTTMKVKLQATMYMLGKV